MPSFEETARNARGHADEIAKRARAQGRGLTANEQSTVDSEIATAHVADLSSAHARYELEGPDGPRTEESIAFRDYLRTGQIRNTALSSTDANGGYIIPEPEHAAIIEKMRKNDPVFGRATVFPMKGDTTLVLPYKSAHGVVTTATETGARAEQTEPTFTAPTLVCYDYFSDQRATQQFLDGVEDAEGMLLTWMAEDIQEQAGADAVSGTGSTSIEGIFHGTTKYTTQFSGSAATVLNTSPLKLYFGLPAQFRANAAWVMQSATLATLVGFASPSNANLPLCVVDDNGQWSLYGKPVLESDSAPALGAGLYAIGFGDIRQAYAVGVHRVTSILRDPYSVVPLVKFYSLARLGGTPWSYEAFQLLRCSTV